MEPNVVFPVNNAVASYAVTPTEIGICIYKKHAIQNFQI
jgi:hypothetical protein